MTKEFLTDRELEVFVFMRSYFKQNDMLPAQKAIAEKFGINHSWATKLQLSLLEKGWIERNEAGKYKFSRGGE